jgi:hypothetical protein
MKWITEARNHLQRIISGLPSDLAESARETALDLLCEELKKIPIPFVGTLLSKTVEKAFKSNGAEGPSIDDVLNILRQMQLSDDDFQRGLSSIGEDIGRLDTLIQSVKSAIEDTKRQLTVPKPIISEPEYKANYPFSDNELWFCLMNIGGGVIKVPEIELRIEDWDPEIKVDYTVPAAPPIILRLKVRLSPEVLYYPLLKINNEPHRRFGAFSDGAEDICIQMSSTANARYRVRIHVPYRDMSSGAEGNLIYPSPEKSPLEVSFSYAPGWDSSIAPDTMLGREEVLSEIITTFRKATSILEKETLSNERERVVKIDHELREVGLPMGISTFPGLTQVLSAFTPPLARMAQLENRTDVFPVILTLAHQLIRYSPSGLHENPPVDALCDVVGRPDLANRISQLFAERDEPTRQRILDEILTKLNL